MTGVQYHSDSRSKKCMWKAALSRSESPRLIIQSQVNNIAVASHDNILLLLHAAKLLACGLVEFVLQFSKATLRITANVNPLHNCKAM